MAQAIDMQVDMTGDELLALYCAAMVGVGTMSGSVELTHSAISMLTDMDVTPEVAASAIRKIRSSVLLTTSLTKEVV